MKYLNSVLAGILVGFLGAFAVNPSDLVMVRIQTDSLSAKDN